MCPACIATVAWVFAGAASTSGLTGLVIRTLRARTGAKNVHQNYGDSALYITPIAPVPERFGAA